MSPTITNPHLTNPAALEAAFASLEKWLGTYNNPSSMPIYKVIVDCPLCMYSVAKAKDCFNWACLECPIGKLTSTQYCEKTPYAKYADIEANYTAAGYAQTYPSYHFSLQIAAYNEYLFLWRLIFDYEALSHEYAQDVGNTSAKNDRPTKPYHTHLAYLTTEYEYADDDGNPFPLTIQYSYLPAQPGYIFGPPENCYPAEAAELEIISIQTEHGVEIPAEWLELEPNLLRDIFNDCLNDAAIQKRNQEI